HAAEVTSPKGFFGLDVCSDYMLANYKGLSSYWKKLATDSLRIKVVSIGKTEEGRDQLMAIISDPSNLHTMDTYLHAATQFAPAWIWFPISICGNKTQGRARSPDCPCSTKSTRATITTETALLRTLLRRATSTTWHSATGTLKSFTTITSRRRAGPSCLSRL